MSNFEAFIWKCCPENFLLKVISNVGLYLAWTFMMPKSECLPYTDCAVLELHRILHCLRAQSGDEFHIRIDIKESISTTTSRYTDQSQFPFDLGFSMGL